MPRQKQYKDFYTYHANEAVCKACGKHLKRSGSHKSSTGLMRHLQAKHPMLFKSYSSATEYYEVEYVLNDMKDGNVSLFLVKWVGFIEDESTWEPEFHLEHAAVHVEAYKYNKAYYAAHLAAAAVLFN